MKIQLKRAYEDPSRGDGARVLVDRLWPRGVAKEKARLKAWLKELAPSDELRKWFHERPQQWQAFRKKYLAELHSTEATSALETLHEMAEQNRVLTLVFASRDELHNNAVVLKDLLEGGRKPPATSGPVRAVAAAPRRAVRPRP